MRNAAPIAAAAILAVALGLAAPALSLDLTLPAGAIKTAEDTQAFDDAVLPIGPWQNGKVETYSAEGTVVRQAWIVRSSLKTTLQLLEPLRASLLENGYSVVFECEDAACGGFDFRYALDLILEPDMHVDLGDFRYLVARPPAGNDYVSLVVSRSASSGFLHITTIGEPTETVVEETTEPTPVSIPVPVSTELSAQLDETGRVVLDDLRFATGSSELEDGPFASLSILADWLKALPDVQISLVGHSDAVGSLEQNIELSRRRAASVMQRLIEAHGVAGNQVSAEGVGYLAPRATNTTPDGRALNRRVEVVRITP